MSASPAMARKPRPFLMRGKPHVTAPRLTIADPPDRRIASVHVEALTPNAIRMLTRDRALDPRFRPVDRYLWRWSVGQGSGLPLEAEEADCLPESRPTPLAPDEAMVVDIAILGSPGWAREFVFMWFRSPATIEEIGKRLQVRSRAVWDERKLVLAYYLGRFTELGIRIPTWEPDA
jgi:hypothetical protein